MSNHNWREDGAGDGDCRFEKKERSYGVYINVTMLLQSVQYLVPCKVSKFVSFQVTDFTMLWRIFHNKVDACCAVEWMRDVYNFCINLSVEALPHCEVEDLNGDEPRHDVHRDLQVLHGVKTVADVHSEGVIALDETVVQTSY